MKLSPEVIRLLPKTDLHLHLDGSLRLQTLIELAESRGITLPAYTEEGLNEKVFKENYADLTEYLKGFLYTVAVLQDPEALERVAYELMEDNILEGVRYIEVRFAPQLHVHEGLDFKEVLASIDRGLSRAAAYYNNRSEAIRNGEEPPYAYGIIACALRKFEPFYSDYFGRFFQIHPYSPARDIYRMASLELVRAVVDIRDRHGIPVVGFDLAGDEKGYPAIDHREAYAFAHKNFLKKTVHAGEAFGPESIFQAITDLYAERIGHGYTLFRPDLVKSEQITDPVLYTERLSQFIADRRITIEVCLTSNLQTDPELKSLAQHTYGKMKQHRVSCTLCTDNRLVSRTSVTRELALALEHFPHSAKDLKNLIIYGFKRSFFPGPYQEKRNYVRKAIDHYERIAAQNILED